MFYKVDSRKRTYAEHWRLAPNLHSFLTAALRKLRNVEKPPSFGIRRPEALDLHAESEVPRRILQRLAPVIGTCAELNIPFQFYASIDTMIGPHAKAYMAAMLHADGWATAMAVGGKPAQFNCFSLLHDGRYIVTSDHRWKLAPHPGDLVEMIEGASPEQVERRHNERLATLRASTVRPEELAKAILTREQRHVDQQIERGVYVPMTAAEVERITGGKLGG